MTDGSRRVQASRWKQWGVVAATVILAGCQVVPKAPPVRPPPPVAPPPVATLPTDAARNRVALLVPLSGPAANVGTSIANAATLAVFDTGGKEIRVTTYDTSGGAAAAAQRALAEGNRLILGPLLAEDVRAVAPVARDARVPVISFSNDVSVAGNGVFVMGYTPAQSVARVVAYARTKGHRTFAGLIPEGVYGERAGAAFRSAVTAEGGTVAALIPFDRATPASLRGAVTKLGKLPHDALLIADGPRTALAAVSTMKVYGVKPAPIMGTELWNSDAATANNPALRGAMFASVADGLFRQLDGKYRARYGRSPSRLASLGYDAVLLVTNIGATWRAGDAFPVSRLLDPGGFTGIDGAFRFRPDGMADRALEVQQAGPTGLTVVSPAPRGF